MYKVALVLVMLGLPHLVSAETIQRYDSHGTPQGWTKCDGGRCQDHSANGTPEGWSQQKGDMVQEYNRNGTPAGSYKIKK